METPSTLAWNKEKQQKSFNVIKIDLILTLARRHCEVLLVDTITQTVRNSAYNSTTDLSRGHLSQLRDALVTVECRVRGADYVRAVFQWT